MVYLTWPLFWTVDGWWCHNLGAYWLHPKVQSPGAEQAGKSGRNVCTKITGMSPTGETAEGRQCVAKDVEPSLALASSPLFLIGDNIRICVGLDAGTGSRASYQADRSGHQ